MTFGTAEMLGRARLVFNLSVRRSLVERLSRRVVHLDEAYFTGEEDDRVYEKLVRIVLKEASDAPGVAVVDDGHPLLFDDVGDRILQRGKRRGLRVLALPSVSSLDALMTECGLRINAVGIQIVEATTLVLFRQELNPTLDTLVLQIGWFGTSLLIPVEAHTAERFVPLQQHLLRFFPHEHGVRILRAPLKPGEKPMRIGCRLERLCRQYRRITGACTLYVPAIEVAHRIDRALLRNLTDKQHLAEIAHI
jgi:uncharacterized protein YabN with tetrapyrrole methylase and pyrophosphatase domain